MNIILAKVRVRLVVGFGEWVSLMIQEILWSTLSTSASKYHSYLGRLKL